MTNRPALSALADTTSPRAVEYDNHRPPIVVSLEGDVRLRLQRYAERERVDASDAARTLLEEALGKKE